MKKIIIYGFLLSFLFSCKKSFLEVTPEDQLSSDNFYKTSSDFNTAVVAAYSGLQSYPSTEAFPLSEYRSDNLYVKTYTTGSIEQFQINKFQDNSTSSLQASAWADMYSGIERCNEVVSRIGTANFSETLKKQYDAECRFIRGFYYFNLVQYFGDLPVVDHPITAKEALTIPRTKVADVYTFIENDLNIAAVNLPAVYSSSADLGRVTSWAAKAVLAKVYLTQGKFSQAQSTLNDIITSGGYRLMNTIDSAFSVNTSGGINNEMNKEILFAIRYQKSTAGLGHSPWFTTTDTTSVSDINPTLKSSYSSTDARLRLIRYTKNGSTFYINKYFDGSPDASTKKSGSDFIVLRYADVLLMYSECLNETGTLSNSLTDPSMALYWLNLVRQRSNKTAPIGIDQCSSKDAVRRLIVQERKLEFTLEGIRWFDLKRTGLASEMILANSGSATGFTNPVTSVPDYRLIYPVPQPEIEKINNPQILDQNQGYY
jgi:hypothetical protein